MLSASTKRPEFNNENNKNITNKSTIVLVAKFLVCFIINIIPEIKMKNGKVKAKTPKHPLKNNAMFSPTIPPASNTNAANTNIPIAMSTKPQTSYISLLLATSLLCIFFCLLDLVTGFID